MARFGKLTAVYHVPYNFNSPVQDTNGNRYHYPVWAEGDAAGTLNENGNMSVRVPYVLYWNDLIKEGHICALYYPDTKFTTEYPIGVPFGGPFIIETIIRAGEYIEFGGPCSLELLKRTTPAFHPIAAETIYTTTLGAAVLAPWALTVAGGGAPPGNDSVTLNTDANIEVGDEIRIQMDSTAWHIAMINGVDLPGAGENQVRYEPRITGTATTGNAVQMRKRWMTISDVTGFAVGQRLVLNLNSGTHESLITDITDGRVHVKDGVSGAASNGNTVKAYDYSEPALDDIEQITDYAPDWYVKYDNPSYTGTEDGTFHAPDGDTVYDLLQSAARQSGESFRLYVSPAAGTVVKSIDWQRPFTLPSFGSNTKIVMPTAAIADTYGADKTKLIPAGPDGVVRRWEWNPVTRIYPISGDDRVSLTTLSAATAAAIATAGYTLVNDAATIGLYGRPYIKNATLEANSYIGTRGAVVNFSHIKAESDKLTEIESASDALAKESLAYLEARRTGRIIYEIADVVCGAPLYPNSVVDVDYADPVGWAVTGAAYVIHVNWHYDATESGDGIPYYDLIVSDKQGPLQTAEGSIARAIRDIEQMSRRNFATDGTSSGGGSIVTVPGGSGSDHGGLTGLTDDDHPQYLRTDGTRTLTGNMAANSGVTIDGVDISAHAADPSAHHAPVTAADTSISVTGQAIAAALRAESGLVINSGLGIALRNQSGLQLSTGLGVLLQANSGMVLGDTGLAMGTPGSLSALTLNNTVSGASHFHSVTAYADARTNYGHLLKTGTQGELTVRRFAVGQSAAVSTATAFLQSFDVTNYTLQLKQLSGQSADILRVENSGGTALIYLTGDGNLESGNPGFTSGLTGWQISAAGDAEFNNVRVRGELHATTFVADEMHATGGTMVLASASTVGAPYNATYNNQLKAIDVTATNYIVVNASYATGLCYFSEKDIVRIKSMGEVVNGGSLYIPDIYLEVSSVVNLNNRNMANGEPGQHVLVCLRKSGGYNGYVVPAGSSIIKWTKSGQGSGAYKGNMLLTADLQYGPYVDVFTVDASMNSFGPWPGSGELRTPPTIKPRVRLGNLDGVLGLPEQWGLAAGTDLSDTSAASKYIVASNLGVTLRNIDLSMYSGASRVIYISPDGFNLLTGTTVYKNDRSILWKNAGGAAVAAIAVRESGTTRVMEMGIDPVFDFTGLSEHGIYLSKDTNAAYGSSVHDVTLNSWGRVLVNAGAEISLYGTYTGTNHMRIGNGLIVGDLLSASPSLGVIRLAQRADNNTYPNATQVDIFARTVSGIQKLYCKFGNGAVRELASA